MDSNMAMVITIAVLIFIAAFFSSVETAFSFANKIRLQSYADNGNSKAKRALDVLHNFDKALTTILVGNNIVNLTTSSIATILCVNIFGNYGAAISTGITTMLVLTFGEVVPKCVAKEHSEAFVLATAGILKFLIIIFTPIVFLFIKLKTFALFLIKSKNTSPSVTEQELKYIIESIESEGVLEEQERVLVQSALDFDEKTITTCLTPRVDVTAIDIDGDTDTNTEIILSERYSRIPVYKDGLDNIIGILHAKDYLEELVRGKKPDLKKLIQPPFFVYKTKTLSGLMNDFKKKKLHIAVVADDYGGTLGIVTMEDLLEELVGDIWDEDEEADFVYRELPDNSYEISGDMRLTEMLSLLGIKNDEIESDSISVGGFIFETVGHIPKKDHCFKIGSLSITVTEISDKRIKRLNVKKELK